MLTLRQQAEAWIAVEPELCAEVCKVFAERAPMGMTQYQKRVFEFIKSYKTERGVVPSYREIGARLSLQKSRVHYIVKGLEQRGFIRRLPGRERSIQIIGSN